LDIYLFTRLYWAVWLASIAITMGVVGYYGFNAIKRVGNPDVMSLMKKNILMLASIFTPAALALVLLVAIPHSSFMSYNNNNNNNNNNNSSI